VLDRAWQLSESDDWTLLLQQLQEVGGPEALYCAAQIYLAAGQIADAFELMEQLVHTDFQHPEYLPGYTLARYGQLADLMGQRDKALQAYRAVLGLSWVPKEAEEIALAGQRTPFRLEP
jgi:tetratricopeptide (TPR) repeat protein